MALKALFLNCTLKKSPEVSNTQALIDKASVLFEGLGVETEVVRVVDYNVPFGVASDMGDGDEWPQLRQDQGVRHPRSGDPDLVWRAGGKVAGVIVTGNEDGAHDAAATTPFNPRFEGFGDFHERVPFGTPYSSMPASSASVRPRPTTSPWGPVSSRSIRMSPQRGSRPASGVPP